MMEDFKITYKGKTVGRIEHVEHRTDALRREATIELRARVDQSELTSQHTLSYPEGSNKLIMAMRQELIDANNPAQRLEWFKKYLTETMVQQTISQEIEANMGKEERMRMRGHLERKSRQQLAEHMDLIATEPQDDVVNQYVNVKRYTTLTVNLKVAADSLKPDEMKDVYVVRAQPESAWHEPIVHKQPKSLLDQIGDL